MFKIMKCTAPTVVREMFTLKKKRDTNFEIVLWFYSVRNGLENLNYLGLKIWGTLPSNLKQTHSRPQKLALTLRNGNVKTVHVNFERHTCNYSFCLNLTFKTVTF